MREQNAKDYANPNYANTASKLSEPSPTPPMMGCAGRQSSKSLLLEHAERLRRQANQVEGLAYAVEHIGGDAEGTLYGILSGEIHRR